MTSRGGRRPAHRGSARRKGGVGKGRNIFLVLSIFLGASLALVLAVPAIGVTAAIRGFLFEKFGWLAVLLPLFLFQSAAWLLDLRMKRAGFRVLTGVAVTGYFFAALLDMTVSLFSPGFHGIPGGAIAGGLPELLKPLVGAPIAYLILFTAFVGSLVAFTGWDLSRDLQGIGRMIASMWRGIRGERRPRPVPSTAPAQALRQEEKPVHAWSEEVRDPVPAVHLPFEPEEPAPRTAAPPPEKSTKPVAVSRPVVHPPVAISDRIDPGIEKGERHILPPLSCLDMPPESHRGQMSDETINRQARLLEEKLADFDILCNVTSIHPGPVITRFEVAPGPGVKVNRFVALSDDLALALKAKRIRILAPIPGKGAVGIEIPNPDPETVFLREIMDSVGSEDLPVALGKRIEGEPIVVDICSTPHLLIAGTTGSGKSVCIHSIIASLLLTKTPSEVRMAMVDPKMLELSIYDGIPHLWAPVVVETKKTGMLLNGLVLEMENRYKRLARTGVRSISEFNSRLTAESEDERIPYIVLFIDELADLMMTLSNEIEPQIARLAQMARAVGIHLVLATQRPSVDVITGVIKANFPSRIAFNVQSKTDSRTILDMNGAEKLLGKGDMLYLPSASPEPTRIHGSFISTEETRTIVDHLKDQPRVPYEFDFPQDDIGNLMNPAGIKIDDPLFEKAKQIVLMTQQGSVSIIQRRLRVGYSRAASLIDMLEQAGVVGPFQGSKAREVLIDRMDVEVPDGFDIEEE
jgi:S-DNA-T family DNA segregation ATPase FtsK/SpoIIIE